MRSMHWGEKLAIALWWTMTQFLNYIKHSLLAFLIKFHICPMNKSFIFSLKHSGKACFSSRIALMTCLVTREQAGSKTTWLSVANVLATNFLLTLPTDMQQHYPNGGMFLCARCKTSNRRELKFHILFYNAVFSTLTSIKNLSTVSEFKLRPHNTTVQHSSKTISTKFGVSILKGWAVQNSLWMEPLGGGGGVPPECPPLSDSLTPLPPSAWRRATVSEGMGTDGKESSGTTLPLPVCPPLCHFLFEVCSFWTNQTSARVPVSFMASYIWCYEMFHRHLPCFIHVIASNLRTLYQDVSLKKPHIWA